MVDFGTLAAESAWNPESLLDTFLHGLSEMVEDELAAWVLPLDLDSLLSLTIRITGHLRECRREKRSVPGHTRSSTVPTLPPEESRKSLASTLQGESDVTRVPSGITEGYRLASSGVHATGQG